MLTRSNDIAELDWFLNNAGSDNEICDKAIEIADRIIRDMKELEQTTDPTLYDKMQRDCDDFEFVLKQIKDRKHKNVLDHFVVHGKKLLKELDL